MSDIKKLVNYENGVFVEKMTPIRKAISKAMTNSKNQIADTTLIMDIDVTKLVALRAKLKNEYEAQGVKLTFLPFIAKAASKALATNPKFNATSKIEAEELHQFEHVNMGLAMDTPYGLIVPVVHNADKLNITEFSNKVTELHKKAMDRKLGMADITKGTFTISNFGSVGIKYATPVINFPEVAILGIGMFEKKLMFNETKHVEERTFLPVSLTIDHRFLDGADGGRFLNDLKKHLEAPETLV